ncbi:MAG: DUF3500 domain-containing protein [Gammaproteobacteria bacterium]|jgi:hypothetical protein|nr:DUF3500 domain-containing protein [Gammaproteobacteria bacterium]MBT6482233.1 DUF3500 domain-containing protein [Gammaproteobacteria bacterium]
MKKITLSIGALLIAVFASFSQVYSQSGDGYPESLLNTKRGFSRGLADAIGQPFRGVATSAGVVSDLFPLKSTGASTATIVSAASTFLGTLNNAELSRTQYAVDDPEWRNWSNVDVGIFSRHGVSLEEMSDQQKTAAWALLRASLSAEGIAQTQDIMKTEQALFELNGEPIRYGEEKYYFTVMGIPSATEPWGWQLDGHHLVINFFVLGDQVVMTPAFWGGEPVFTESGKYAGNRIMQDEQDQGLAFMQSLDAAQQAAATIDPNKTRNNQLAAANEDNLTLDYEGLRGSELSSAQKSRLLNLIRVYIANMRAPHADITMDEIGQHIGETYFSWIGNAEDDAVFYYRVHSPVILIEFDHQNPVGTTQINAPGMPTRDHIHTIVRTPNGNDYGKDLLAQHLAAHPH